MPTRIPPELRKYLAALGRKGGRKAADAMTPDQRTERAKKAAAARWKMPKKNERG